MRKRGQRMARPNPDTARARYCGVADHGVEAPRRGPGAKELARVDLDDADEEGRGTHDERHEPEHPDGAQDRIGRDHHVGQEERGEPACRRRAIEREEDRVEHGVEEEREWTDHDHDLEGDDEGQDDRAPRGEAPPRSIVPRDRSRLASARWGMSSSLPPLLPYAALQVCRRPRQAGDDLSHRRGRAVYGSPRAKLSSRAASRITARPRFRATTPLCSSWRNARATSSRTVPSRAAS